MHIDAHAQDDAQEAQDDAHAHDDTQNNSQKGKMIPKKISKKAKMIPKNDLLTNEQKYFETLRHFSNN